MMMMLTPLISPWTIPSLCRYSRPCAMSKHYIRHLKKMGLKSEILSEAYQRYTICVGSSLSQVLHYISIL